MKRLILVAAVAVILLAACSGDGEQTTVEVAQADQSGISVTGVGEVFGAPDTLTVTIGVRVTEASVEEAADEAAASSEAIIDALVDEGVNREDIQTQQFSIFPEYDFSGERQELVGYTVTNTVVAKITDIEAAGETIDAAVEAGGDDTIVDSVGFGIEDDSERIAEARERAWADAESKAQQLADLAGVSLGSAVAIAEGVDTVVPTPQFGAAEASFDAVPIEPGQVASTVTVSVRYAIRS